MLRSYHDTPCFLSRVSNFRFLAEDRPYQTPHSFPEGPFLWSQWNSLNTKPLNLGGEHRSELLKPAQEESEEEEDEEEDEEAQDQEEAKRGAKLGVI